MDTYERWMNLKFKKSKIGETVGVFRYVTKSGVVGFYGFGLFGTGSRELNKIFNGFYDTKDPIMMSENYALLENRKKVYVNDCFIIPYTDAIDIISTATKVRRIK